MNKTFYASTVFFLSFSLFAQAQNSPGQSEFSTYAPAGQLEMVDLSTGNFRFNIPVLEIPGPEGSFELPLHYRAGIGLNQEASWVGLGWSLNAGAITRTVNQFPDDANGEPLVIINKNPGRRGWYARKGVVNLGWDSQEGHVGNVDIGVASLGWKNGLNSGSIAGVGYQHGKGMTFDPLQLMNAAMTIATAGTANSISGAMGITSKAAAVGVEIGISSAMSVGIAQAASGLFNPSSKAGGYTRVAESYERQRQSLLSYTNYWLFIDNNSAQRMYGPLYFQNLGVGANPKAKERKYGPYLVKGSSQSGSSEQANVFYVEDRPSSKSTSYRTEVSADVTLPIKPELAVPPARVQNTGDGISMKSPGYQKNNMLPLSVAYDNFTVMAPGISGNIRPYRLDVGSVSFPRQMNDEHFKYNLVPFTQTKPDFIYEGSASNKYEHPQGTGNNFGKLGLSQQWSNGALTLDDPLLYDPATRIEPNRYGLTGGNLVQGRQVEWFTNEEMGQEGVTNPVTQGKILNFAVPKSKTLTKKVIYAYYSPCFGSNTADCDLPLEPIYQEVQVTVADGFRAELPEQGIGAFVVTGDDGTRYHFSLPVYHYKQYTRSWNTNKPKEYTSEKMGFDNSNYAYATAWLLTAITGPDFVDKGTIGVLDDADEGRWVKFEYGRFSPQFKWRTPYHGNAVIDNGTSTLADGSAAPTFQAYSEGYKETYYLNAISTRSHTALFIKDVRQDGRGHYTSANGPNPNLNIDDSQPASSLRLNDIILLANEDYKKIIQDYGFGTDTRNNGASRDISRLASHDSFTKVFDSGDLDSDPAISAYVREHLVKRIQFHYSYKLCPNTDNSFASAKEAPIITSTTGKGLLNGKLTLESISELGANNAKLIPDFKFEYGFNPPYDAEKYDAYGFYKRERKKGDDLLVNSSMTAINGDGQSQASEDGSAWSLKRIHNPLGSITEINYERDQYGSVSGVGSERANLSSSIADLPKGVLSFRRIPLDVDLSTIYKVGQKIEIQGSFIAVFKRVNPPRGVSAKQGCFYPYTGTHTIVAVTATSITIDNPPAPIATPTQPCSKNDGYSYIFEELTEFSFTVSIPGNTNGGDIRVAKVKTYGDNKLTQQIRYLYTSNLYKQKPTSTGVLAKEPEKGRAKWGRSNSYIKPSDDSNYPVTPVIYGEVTELRGAFKNDVGQIDDNKFDVRTVYGFHTPNLDMFSQRKTDILEIPAGSAGYPNYKPKNYKVGLSMAQNITRVNTALIGQPKWVRNYDKRGVLERETVYNYTNDITNDAGIAHQGYFSEGALLSEMIKLTGTDNTSQAEERWFSLNKSIKTTVPTYLTGTTTTVNGIRSEADATLSYDFFTAAPLVTESVNSLGVHYRAEQTPAYKLARFKTMGPQRLNPKNKNMLSQMAASSASKVLPDGTLGVLGAATSTWRRSWTTRKFDPATGQYAAVATPSAEQVWRLHRSFAWQGTKLNADGTVDGFVPFNWNTPTAAGQNSGWVQQAQITGYDAYSRPLQSEDVNGIATAEKAGYNQQYTLATATNARYDEIAYSGAEDQLQAGSAVHFGGEVRDGEQRSTDYRHTGTYSSRLAAGQTGFTYQATVGNANGVRPNRTYRASVWVYKNNVAAGARLYFSLDGTIVKETSVADATTKQAGEWMLLNLYLPLLNAEAGKKLLVGCRNEGAGSVYVDDFRFHPIDAPLTTYVYDLRTKQTRFVLDNDNLYTEYEYDAAGKLTKVYQEVLTKSGDVVGSERHQVQESAYNYAHLRDPNWIPTDKVRCVTKANGLNTGSQEAEEVDSNTASQTYNQKRWVGTGRSAACPTCTGMQRWVNGQCEEPVITCATQSLKSGTGGYVNKYTYTYTDGFSTSRTITEATGCPPQRPTNK